MWTNHSGERASESDHWTNKPEFIKKTGVTLAELQLAEPSEESRLKWTLRSLELKGGEEDIRDGSDMIKTFRAQEFGTHDAEILRREFEPTLISSSHYDRNEGDGLDRNSLSGRLPKRADVRDDRESIERNVQKEFSSTGRDIHSESLERESRTPKSMNSYSRWRYGGEISSTYFTEGKDKVVYNSI